MALVYARIPDGSEELKRLHLLYKAEIGEDPPSEEETDRLFRAIREEKILFYGCFAEGKLVGCCSVCVGFSTFNYLPGGVFEDFCILPEYRHRGIARALAETAFRESGVASLTVGCADCDADMYRAIGFRLRLGNLLAYDAEPALRTDQPKD